MKKFSFNLETLLKVRQEEENLAKQALAEAQAVVQSLHQQIEALNAEGQATETAMSESKKKAFSAEDLAASLAYLDTLRTRIAVLEDEVMRANNVVNQRRQAATKAMQERKAIENLKEKRYEEWKQEANRLERNFLDEQATMRYVQGQSEG